MQRLYVMFPDRGPGLGLLWLRLCVAGGLLAGGTPAAAPGLLCLVAIGLLLPGLLTPLAVLLAVPGLYGQDVVLPWLLLPLALLLLGPGAYSLDAWLFGRRLLPRRPPPNG
ncbi:hypothetical protein [Stenotrophomonas indicatrix]|uniref:hypothetical protein n=1 Tax=Stenotrophomonas indicatrix TaxID=2045451 RepID=UPI00215A9E00|nr:hypothetical protein [Stenotrophomonas indicatrix]MCR8716085.1 hypothetical protein [Stenotrophomonas indicatrix]